MRAHELISEGKNDPHTFKAIFMIGSPGSGKSTVAKKIAAGTGLKMVNSDTVYEWLTAGTDMPIISKGYEDELYRHSNRLVRKQMENYIDGRLGLLIDSTGKKVSRMKELKERLEKLGYETMAVFVNTDINTALDRNEQRRRKVDTQWVRDRHAEIQSNLGDYQNLFSGKLVIVDNSDGTDLEHAIPHAAMRRFLNSTPKMPQAKKWLGEDMGITPTDEDYGKKLDILANKIRTEARPWLSKVGLQKKIYRGFTQNSADYVKIRSPRENRNPLNSPRELQEYWNKVIQEKGLVANRSNSFFVTGDKGFAEGYGEVYIGIPLGDFNYTWAPGFKDWYLMFSRAAGGPLGGPLDQTYELLADINDSDIEPLVDVKRKLNSHLRGDDGSIIKAIESNHEILIHAKEMLFIHPHVWRDLIQYKSEELELSNASV